MENEKEQEPDENQMSAWRRGKKRNETQDMRRRKRTRRTNTRTSIGEEGTER